MTPRSDLYVASLARGQPKKGLALRTYAGAGVRFANCVVATDPRERDEFWQAGFRNPVALIPHGIDSAFGESVRAQNLASVFAQWVAKYI